MVGQITSVVGERKANISDMINRSRNQIAYTMLDLDEPLARRGRRLYGIGGIKRIRVIDSKANGARLKRFQRARITEGAHEYPNISAA
jgi:hypothetical protein